MLKLLIPLLVTAPLSIPAVANPVDNSSATKLDPSQLLNTAYRQLRSGQRDAARTTFRQVLHMEGMTLDRPDGHTVWSHDLARDGLKQIDSAGTTVAAR